MSDKYSILYMQHIHTHIQIQAERDDIDEK